MKFYICGSVSDGGTLPPEERAVRIEGFNRAEQRLLGMAGDVEVLNPARHGSDPNKTWLDYMRLTLLDVAQADAIVTLPGWEKSRGALVEVSLANGLGLPVGTLGNWLEILSVVPEAPSQPDEDGAGEPDSPPMEESPNV